MKRTMWWHVLLVVISISVPGTAPAANYLKLDGIDGESTAKGHENWIELNSFSFGVTTTTGSASGGGVNKPLFSDFTFTQFQDSSTPKEFEALVENKHIATGILDLVRTTKDQPFTYLKYTFSDIVLTSMNFSDGGARPIETVTFKYGAIKLDAFSLDDKGQSVLVSSAAAAVSSAPEPSTWALLGAGLLLVAAQGRRLARSRNE